MDNRFILPFVILAAMLILGFGCNTSKPAPDPLAGFYPDALYTPDTNKAITGDYKKYLQTLSPDEQKFVAYVECRNAKIRNRLDIIHIPAGGKKGLMNPGL